MGMQVTDTIELRSLATQDLESMLADVIQLQEHEQEETIAIGDEIAASPNIEIADEEDDDNASTEEFDAVIVVQRMEEAETCGHLAMIIAASNSKIPVTSYTNDIKSKMDSLVLQLKCLETFLLSSGREGPPDSLSRLHDEWVTIEETVKHLQA